MLGTGVIALPALAAAQAGPASLLAWLLLVAVSAPLAAAFAALGARFGDSGGVSTYAGLAFGEHSAAVVGWCFYLAVPLGTAAAALFGGSYVEAAVGGGSLTRSFTALALVAVATGSNAMGVRLVGRMQLLLAGLLCSTLLLAVALSLSHARAANLRPFAPHGWLAVGPAAATLVWSFVGWEAITHLSGEFRDPRRDVPRATGAAVVVIGLLYMLLAFSVIAVLGPGAARTEAPLGELMARGIGGQAGPLAAGAAVLLTLGSTNAYVAGAANLGAALGARGALPAWLDRGQAAGEVPRRSLLIVSTLTFAALITVIATGMSTGPLVRLTNSALVTVYAIGMAAAVRLLPRRSSGFRCALVSLAAIGAVLLFTGWYLLWPAALTAASSLYLRLRRSKGSR